MKVSLFKLSKSGLLAASALTGTIALSAAVPAQAAPADYISPIYTPAFGPPWGYDESQYTLPSPTTNASVGYTFETTRDNVKVNALGMPAFISAQDWVSGNNVTVYLSKKDPVANTYTTLASVVFTPSGVSGYDPNYLFKDGYYWQFIPVVDLGLKSDSDPAVIFETMAQANYAVMPYLADGAGTFADVAAYNTNGFSDTSDTGTPGYPNGIWQLQDINNVDLVGFWNPNVSYIVPSPLPIFGAGVAFSYARRMRSRIRRSTNQIPASM
jgi:hypothetical protein